MTGFGKADSQAADLSLDVTIKTVNGRFLEIKIHSPKIYSSLEIEIRKKLATIFKRGTVDVYINRKSLSGSEQVTFNKKLAKNWLKGFNQLAADLKLDSVADPRILLSIPDFVKVEDQTLSLKESKTLFKTLGMASEKCRMVRGKEGLGLLKDIRAHLSQLSKRLGQMKKLRARTLKDLEQKYKDRLEKLELDGHLDEQRLAQEVVVQIDKTDINEEIQRLGSHLDALDSLLVQKGSIGKKLDFYGQELLREINTIGSKSTSSELTQHVVEAKSLIEKYREQVQNVE